MTQTIKAHDNIGRPLCQRCGAAISLTGLSGRLVTCSGCDSQYSLTKGGDLTPLLSLSRGDDHQLDPLQRHIRRQAGLNPDGTAKYR